MLAAFLLAGILHMAKFVIVLPTADTPGFNTGTPYPATPTTHFDKVDEYPTSDEDTTGLSYDLSIGPGTEYFGIDPAVVSALPGGDFLSLEAVMSVYAPSDGVDVLNSAAVVTPGPPYIGIGQSQGMFLALGWHTIILDMTKIDGTPWNKADLSGASIVYLLAGGGTAGVKVSQFYVRIGLDDRPYSSASSLAPRASGTSILGCSAAPSSLAPSGAPSSLAPAASAARQSSDDGSAQ